jgi:hypothetical protein
MKFVQYLSVVAGIVLALAGVILPVVGADGVFARFKTSYSATLHAKMLASQLVAPVLLLLLQGLIVYCTFYQKRIPFWIGVMGAIGAFGMVWNVGGFSHDFSHVVFEECSDKYGQVISWLAGLYGLLLVTTLVLNARRLRGHGYFRKRMTRRTRWIFALGALFSSWLAVLYFLGVIPG